MVSRINGKDELYDLTADQQELHNLFGESGTETITAELKTKQLTWLIETADVVPYDYDSRFSNEMIWAKVKRLVPPEYEDEIKAQIAGGTNMFILIQQCKQRFGSLEKGETKK